MKLTIGISGKRYFEDDNGNPVKLNLEKEIDNILTKGNREFIGYSMLAAGADTIFAELVLDKYKQPLQVVLPFPIAVYEEDFKPAELARFKELIARAAHVTILHNTTPASGEEKNERFREAGRAIAKKASHMLFVWDGQKPASAGGTADILSYFSENYPSECLHLINVLPHRPAGLQSRLDDAFEKSNASAVVNKEAHDKIWEWSLFFGWLAVLIFAYKTGFQVDGQLGWILTTAEFISLTLAAGIVIRGKTKKFHLNFLKERIRAEQLRLITRFYHAGAAVEIPILAERGDEELPNFVKQINHAAKHEAYESKWYANFVIKNLVSSQKAYHQKKITLIGEKPEWYERLNYAIVGLFFINLTAHFILATGLYLHWFEEPSEVVHHVGTMLSILLPGSYAAVEGILFFQDWQKIKNHSGFVKKNLEDCEVFLPQHINEMDDTECKDKQLKVITAVATTMINDNLNWQIIIAEKSNYHWVV